MSGKSSPDGNALFRAHLSSDPETADARYFEIREKLMLYFTHRRCADPEDLASEVLRRAIVRCEEGAVIENGILNYCYGIAANILREEWRRPRPAEPPDSEASSGLTAIRPEAAWNSAILLQQILRTLPSRERALITSYFLHDNGDLEGRMDTTRNALRISVHRILEKLRRQYGAELRPEIDKKRRVNKSK